MPKKYVKTDKKREYDNAFIKKTYHQIAIKLNKEKEKDVIDWLLSQAKMKDSIVELVRERIAAENENK